MFNLFRTSQQKVCQELQAQHDRQQSALALSRIESALDFITPEQARSTSLLVQWMQELCQHATKLKKSYTVEGDNGIVINITYYKGKAQASCWTK
jgi:hypothetical protein